MTKSIAINRAPGTILPGGFTSAWDALGGGPPFILGLDMVNSKVVTGTVKKMDWSNPHSWIWLDVANEQGVVETWGIEGMSPNYLARRGWTRTTLKPGDKLTVTLHPMRNGEKGGSFMSAKRPDGSSVGMTGPITEP